MTTADVADAEEIADAQWTQRLRTLRGVAEAGLQDGSLRCADRDLSAVVVGLEVTIRQLQAVQSAVVADAVSRGVPARAGCKGGAGWFRWLTNVSPPQAALRANIGEVLLGPPGLSRAPDPDLAPAREALISGAITAEHAEVVIETADLLAPPAVDPQTMNPAVRSEALRFLVEKARALNVYQLRTASRRLVAHVDPEGDERLARDEDRQAAHRGLTLSRTGPGLVQLTGTLTSECAGLLATAIDAGSAPRPAADGTPDDRTAAMRRHDSLLQLVRQVVAADGVLPTTHGTAYRLVVTVPHRTVASALRGERLVGAQPATLPDGWPLSSLTATALACTAELVPVLVDDVGNPLDVGDAQYLFPPRIRMAIISRDQGCTWPGCGAPASWCDTHHLTPFSAGGPTSVDNGALLCGRHHRHVHSHGFVGEVRDGAVHWNLSAARGAFADGETVVQRLVSHLGHRQRRHREQRRQ